MGRNNKKNMKLQLKKPQTYKSNKNYGANHSNDQGLMSNFNAVNLENLENVNIDPALLNHINNIRNVDERMLIWNTNDVMDKEANDHLYSCLNVDMVIRSMQVSPFAGYLQKQIDQLNKVSRPSLSGVVMMPIIIDSINNSDLSYDVNNSKTIEENVELTTCVNASKESLNVSTENIECDVSSSTMSTNRIDQLNLSPAGMVRSSGRSAKKNYLDMLQQPFIHYRKSPGSISEKSKLHDSLEKKKKNSRQSKRKSEVDISVNGLSLLNLEHHQESPNKDDSTKEKIKGSLSADNITSNEEKQVEETDAREISYIDTKIDCEETQRAIDDTLSNGACINTIPNSVIEKFDKMNKKSAQKMIETSEIRNNCDMLDNCKKVRKKRTCKPKKDLQILESTGWPNSVNITSTIECVRCKGKVESKTTFPNLCLSCSSDAEKIMNIVHNELDLVCVLDPPCWSDSTHERVCCAACKIQQYIEHGIEWTDKYWSFIGLTTERLRHPRMVTRAKQAMLTACQALVDSHTVFAGSCVLPVDEPLSSPCQWDLGTFTRTKSRDHECTLCQNLPAESESLYEILPSRDNVVCHKCLLRLYATQANATKGSCITDPTTGNNCVRETRTPDSSFNQSRTHDICSDDNNTDHTESRPKETFIGYSVPQEIHGNECQLVDKTINEFMSDSMCAGDTDTPEASINTIPKADESTPQDSHLQESRCKDSDCRVMNVPAFECTALGTCTTESDAKDTLTIGSAPPETMTKKCEHQTTMKEETCEATIESCDRCLLRKAQSVVPIEAVRHRYRPISDQGIDCRLCQRLDGDDDCAVTTTRLGTRVCVVCVCRVRIQALRGAVYDLCDGECPLNTCNHCLITVAAHVVSMRDVMTQIVSLPPLLAQEPPVASTSPQDKDEDHCQLPWTEGVTTKGDGMSLESVDNVGNHTVSRKRPLTWDEAVNPPKSSKTTDVSDGATNSKQPKRRRSKNKDILAINAVWANFATDRQRRITKPTQFTDYIVGEKGLTKLLNRKTEEDHAWGVATESPATKKTMLGSNGSQKLVPGANVSQKTELTLDNLLRDDVNDGKVRQVNDSEEDDEQDVLDLGDHKIVDGHEAMTAGSSVGKYTLLVRHKTRGRPRLDPSKKKSKFEGKDKVIRGKAAGVNGLSKPDHDRGEGDLTFPRKGRIKQAMIEVCEPLIVRTGGPRVKQVSRVGVNTGQNPGTEAGSHNKCLIKATMTRTPKWIDQTQENHSVETQGTQNVSKEDTFDELMLKSDGGFSLALSTDQIDSSVAAEVQARVLDDDKAIGTNTCKDADATETANVHDQPSQTSLTIEVMTTTASGHSESLSPQCDPKRLMPSPTPPPTSTARLPDLDVYRDSDNEDTKVNIEDEKEPGDDDIDPDLDSIQTAKIETVTTSLAHEGGYPVVTSRRAMPNKVLCYSCGSGGDQMIHCVSCAEPFHFFCIEFQFRPKSKEMFVCRNCTRCHVCRDYGSDLKCIKCQLGFHPSCVDRYPPSRTQDRSNWACYQCAMCLHCGTKALDIMNQGSGKAAIDWASDPWQCGRCSKARKQGLVCPDCGRAYQDGMETVDCHRCTKSVHRQCAGLTEDEYEMHKEGPVPATATYECSECEAVSAAVDDSGQTTHHQDKITTSVTLAHGSRVRLKRSCKESSLKLYCETQVTRRIADYIRDSEASEEQLLDEHIMAGVARGDAIALDQMDGSGDTEDSDEESTTAPPRTHTSPAMTKTASSTAMCNSSESIEEYDLDQLTGSEDKVDLPTVAAEVTKTKTGIFSRLVADDFLSPRHLVMEAVARILVKLGRYSPQSSIGQIYDCLIGHMEHLCQSMFPWVDFSQCVDQATDIVKGHSARTKQVLKAVADTVRDGLQREMDVFSSTVWDIEDKLYQSLVRGRDEFIVYHSEQNLAALMKSLEFSEAPSQDTIYCKYKRAFVSWQCGSGGAVDDEYVYEDDVRRCGLCGQSGDDGLEGRLIYGQVDVWVHVNCALWSDEVYEREDGALVNMDLALERGRKTICASCSHPGATVRCGAEEEEECQHCYHFSCAFNRLRDPVFTESRTFYCSEMLHARCKGETQLGLADMLILRRIYMPRCVSMSRVSSEDIVVTIGCLRIDRLGRMRPHCDQTKVLLCPVDYRARRLFWSINELDTLVMYSMLVTDEANITGLKAPKADMIVAAPVSHQVPRSAPTLTKRRRVIDTVDSRQAKRPRGGPQDDDMGLTLMGGSKRDIVYEMDDYGNLRAITEGPITTLSSMTIATKDKPDQKVNRRFPKESQPRKRVETCATASTNDDDDDNNAVQILSIDLPPGRPVPLYQPSTIPVPQPVYFSTTNHKRGHHNKHPTKHMVPVTHHSLTTVPPPPPPPPTNYHHQLIHAHHNQSVPRSITLTNINNERRFSILNNQRTAPRPAIIIRRNNGTAGMPINRPPTVIRLPSALTTATHNHQASPAIRLPQQHRQQQLLKVTKLTPVTRPSPSMDHNLSVLRTVLTDNLISPLIPEHPPRANYLISSSGTLKQRTSSSRDHLPQYDGEADTVSMVDDSISSCGSEHDTSTTVTLSTNKTKKYTKKEKLYSEYNRILKFTIDGFTTNRSPKSAWTCLAKKLVRTRALHGCTEYPLRMGDGWAKFGLNHRCVVYLIEQMVGAYACQNYDFKYHRATISKIREQVRTTTVGNGSRSLHWVNEQPDHVVRDPLAFLRCKSNLPPVNHAPEHLDPLDDREPDADYIQRLAIQFRKLKSGVLARVRNVRVCVSEIHGRGLFARREFSPHEIIIEYVGETIRSVMSDVRELEYQKTGVDCYMFRLDQDIIVDATYKGNAARFINHSCQPNCYAKVVKFEGEKHIIIIAQRRIYKGEELTYDYRFPLEEDKLVCTCGSRRCRKYLN